MAKFVLKLYHLIFWPPSATVVSVKPLSHGTGTLRCLQKEMAIYRHWSVSLWQDPDDVSHCRILSPDKTEWRLISATLCGWRRCFVVDQLWLMKRIREEDHISWLWPCDLSASRWHNNLQSSLHHTIESYNKQIYKAPCMPTEGCRGAET